MIRKWWLDVKTCNCKALMRGRWSRDGAPKVYACERCGKPVTGYEELWKQRKSANTHKINE